MFVASFRVILNLVILVSVIGKYPFLLYNLKILYTDPLLPKTFPYLTTENLVSDFPTILFADTKSLSEHNFVAPYKLIGAQALSVDKATIFFTLLLIEAKIKFCAPIIFVFTASNGLYSAAGTCFSAAACIIFSMFLVANESLSRSLISPKKKSNKWIFFFWIFFFHNRLF